MLKKIVQQFVSQKSDNKTGFATNPVLAEMSRHALDLYVKKSDIKKFTGLVLSNPEDKSHNKLVEKLIEEENIIDPLDEEHLKGLIGNDNFLRDMGL